MRFQDVKTYTAFCLAHVLRLHTADCPYSTAQQQVGLMQGQCTQFMQSSCIRSGLFPWCRKTCVAWLQGIFGLFMWIFRRLENANAPSFQMCHSILDVVSQVGGAHVSCSPHVLLDRA